MANIKSVLFVCTGNSCRSIMAEGVLREYLKRSGKDKYISALSAGTCTVEGVSPAEATISVMKKESIDVSDLVSKCIDEEMIKRADLILTMEGIHKEEVLRIVPDAAGKTFLFKEFGIQKREDLEGLNLNIRDPIGKPMEVYEHCLDEIKEEIVRIVKLL